MFARFHRKRSVDIAAPATLEAPEGFWPPKTPAALLATPRRQRLLEHVWQRTSLSRTQFELLYRSPLHRYAALVQLCPASESHHHAYPGGMLDHGLEIVAVALKLRQSILLPVGAPPETQAAQAEAWTAAVAYAALLHDVGKLAVDLHVEYADGTVWHPWNGPLTHPYRFRYRKGREYRLHNAAAGLLYTDVLNEEILDWLSGFEKLWASLLYVLAGQYEHAGVLGELVIKADQASVASALGGDPGKALAAPKQALQRKLADGLRYLAREQLRLNQPEASDGWLTADSLWLVSKTVCDKLRAHLLSHGVEGVPANNIAVFDVLQEHGLVQPTSDNKAIWHATVESETGWTHSFTLLRLSPALIWEPNERPIPFAGTVRPGEKPPTNSAAAPAASPIPEQPREESATVSDHAGGRPAPEVAPDLLRSALELLEPTTGPTAASPSPRPTELAVQLEPGDVRPVSGISPSPNSALTSSDPTPAPFMEWLRDSIQTHRLIINEAKALVHTVAGTAFLVSPGIFQRYIDETTSARHPTEEKAIASWQSLQKSFERLRLHRKQPSGLNIWTCEITGPRKKRRLHGYLLLDGHNLFQTLRADNPYLSLSASSQPNTLSA